MTNKFRPNQHSILILVRALNTGGAERQALLNAISLQKLGYHVDIACFYDSDAGGYVLSNSKISKVILSNKQGSISRCAINFIKLIVKKKYSVVYSFTGVPNLIALLAKAACTRTIVIWGKRATKLNLQDYGFKYSIEIYLEKLLSRFPDLIISNSDACKVELEEEGFPSSRVVTIHNAIDTHIFRPKKLLIGELENLPFDNSKEIVVIGCVGRIDPMKGHVNLIYAFFEALKQNSHLRLVIVGNDKKKVKVQLDDLAQSLNLTNKIFWIEHVNNPENLYQNFDILTLASDYGEGFPNVLAEAMACGVRCVATDVGDSRLILGPYGEVVPPRNSKALSDAWLRSLDREPKPSKVMWDYIDSKFSINILQNKMKLLMEEIIRANRY